MGKYYSNKLSAGKLMECYEIAPPRIKQYLDAEAEYVFNKIKRGDTVLELGCGYGRVLPLLAKKAGNVIGIDTSKSSLEMGRHLLSSNKKISLFDMNAVKLDFENDFFDAVVCIQNGISAFHVNQTKLIKESIRVTKPGGMILFSSYSEKIWKDRLKWFHLQSKEGLIGEIDINKTKNGRIICRDGFSVNTVTAKKFKILASKFTNIKISITEVDSSSIFLEIIPFKK